MELRTVAGVWCPIGDPFFTPRLEETGGLMDMPTIRAACGHARDERRTAVDVGAHIGTWTRVLAGQFERVLAFEPHPQLYQCLRLNVAEIGNVRAYPMALAARGGEVLLDFQGVNSGQCFVGDQGVRECAIALDDLGLEGVDLVKVDVEGFELAVLRGAEATIRREKPVVAIEENACALRYGQQPGDAGRLLESWGMKEVWRAEFYPNNHDVVFDWVGRCQDR